MPFMFWEANTQLQVTWNKLDGFIIPFPLSQQKVLQTTKLKIPSRPYFTQ